MQKISDVADFGGFPCFFPGLMFISMDERTREYVQKIFVKVDARFEYHWSIPWIRVLKCKERMDDYTKRYTGVDWSLGGLIQLCRPGAADYYLAYRYLAEREVRRHTQEKHPVTVCQCHDFGDSPKTLKP
jgi:hypothetical protein